MKSRRSKANSMVFRSQTVNSSGDWSSVLKEKNNNVTLSLAATFAKPLSKKNMMVTKTMKSKLQKIPLNYKQYDQNSIGRQSSLFQSSSMEKGKFCKEESNIEKLKKEIAYLEDDNH